MDDDAYDHLVDIFFHAFPAADGQEIGHVINYIIRLIDREVRRARCEERRQLYVRAGVRSKN